MHLLALAAAFTAGVYLGGRVELPEAVVGLFGLAAVLCVAGTVVQRRGVLPAFVVLAVLVGVARTGADGDDAAAAYLAFHGQRGVQIEGVVDGDPEAAGQSLRFPFSVERIAVDGASTEEPGRVLVTVSPSVELVRARSTAPIRDGDRLMLSGTIERPPRGTEGFDYPAYLASQGIAAVVSFPEVELLREAEGPGTWLAGARRALARSLDAAVPEPQSAMGQALLLGNRDNLPDDLLEDFRATGASHLLAISGLHMTVVLGIVLAVSSWAIGRRRQLYLIPPLAAMWAYALLAGMPPSAERAAIMGTVYLAAFALGRPRSVLPALGLAAAVMVAVDPGVLSAPSFQLSVAAMAGIATLAEPISTRLRAVFGARDESGDSPRPLVQFAASSAATTVAATVATLPLVAFHFERVSLVGLPATLVTLPVMPLVLIAHGAAGLAGLVSIELAQPFGWGAWITTAYLTGVVGLIARLPGTAFQTGAVAPVLVVAYYVALIGIYLRRPLRRGGGPGLGRHPRHRARAGPRRVVVDGRTGRRGRGARLGRRLPAARRRPQRHVRRRGTGRHGRGHHARRTDHRRRRWSQPDSRGEGRRRRAAVLAASRRSRGVDPPTRRPRVRPEPRYWGGTKWSGYWNTRLRTNPAHTRHGVRRSTWRTPSSRTPGPGSRSSPTTGS